MYKIVTFCPETDIDSIISAMADAGAGIMGDYTHCVFIMKGEGNWLPGKGARPTIGQVGKMSREPECRIEMICADGALEQAVAALRRAHSYETPEIDVIKLHDL